MARAIAICMCATCGTEFEKVAFKRNRTEADSWQEWAEANCDECPECYAKRMAQENAEKVQSLNLPEITGKSEKQIAYALDLRVKYAVNHTREIKYVKKMLHIAQTDEAKAQAAAAGMTVEEVFKATIEKMHLQSALVCMIETEAHKIIEALI